ncbi:hypothetical protein [Ignatzschineria cameli]|uniref:hypothetical protein n=1 Tax=Ignatzschineria cameli TaxID=2182793 RepID=UPI001863D44E|nr:hypothetical protein [Ignatzschineria cameli]
MKKDEIYQLLKKNNANATMIANALDVTPQAVQSVISNGKGSRRIAKAVAVLCNKSLIEVFPHFKNVPTKQEVEKRQRELDVALAKFA